MSVGVGEWDCWNKSIVLLIILKKMKDNKMFEVFSFRGDVCFFLKILNFFSFCFIVIFFVKFKLFFVFLSF